MNETTEIRRRIAEACRVLGELGLTQSTYGHVSARAPGSDRFFIRARGPAEDGVQYATESGVIEIDLNGDRVGGEGDGYASPIEVHIHTQLYKNRPEVNSVVHVHPASPVLLSVCDKPLLPIFGAYDVNAALLAIKGVPAFKRSELISTPELGQELAETIGKSEVCVMRGHGITTAANSIEEAALLAIHLNDLAKMNYQAHLLGDVTAIPVEEQEKFLSLDVHAGYGEPTPGAPAGRAANLWRYYVRLTHGKPVDG